MARCPFMTTEAGIPVADNQHSISAGEQGPLVMSNHHLMEKMAHFNRERIPERVVHAKGAGAYGRLTITHDLSRYTCARLFSKAGNQCDMLIRFSTVAGDQGTPDTARDPRGFACKFYTEDGNWDLVGNNTPVFFVRDPLKFADFIHSQKRHPQTGMRDNTMQWDYWSLSPESLHQVTILFSDRGIPKTYRHMHGFSSHTYSFWNEKGERFWIKWHFKTQQGIQCLTDAEAAHIAAHDLDAHRRDLFEAIARKDYPKWRVQIQIMPEKDAATYAIPAFDLTKVWPHRDYPLMDVGEFELNRNPDNYFAEIEQAAFEPNNSPIGIGFSPDKVLQARLMTYADAHRYRVGTNYTQLPVNKPRCPVHNYQRDGHMRFDGNQGGSVNYQPNSFGGPIDDARFKEPPFKNTGDIDSYAEPSDHYQQPGDLYRLMPENQKVQLIDNLARSMAAVPKDIQQRQIAHFTKADPDYGRRVAQALGLSI